MTFKIGHLQSNTGKTHWKEGEHISELTEFKKGDIRISGEKNKFWKGDKVGNKALHSWVSRQIGNPHKCLLCEKEGRVELSNKNGKYTRELSNWQWLCSKCHKKYDNIGNKVWETRRKNGTDKFYNNQYTKK